MSSAWVSHFRLFCVVTPDNFMWMTCLMKSGPRLRGRNLRKRLSVALMSAVAHLPVLMVTLVTWWHCTPWPYGHDVQYHQYIILHPAGHAELALLVGITWPAWGYCDSINKFETVRSFLSNFVGQCQETLRALSPALWYITNSLLQFETLNMITSPSRTAVGRWGNHPTRAKAPRELQCAVVREHAV